MIPFKITKGEAWALPEETIKKIVSVNIKLNNRSPAFFTIYKMWRYDDMFQDLFCEKDFHLEKLPEKKTQGFRPVILSMDNARQEDSGVIIIDDKKLPKEVAFNQYNAYFEEAIAEKFFNKKITFTDNVQLKKQGERSPKYKLFYPIKTKLFPQQEKIIKQMLSSNIAYLNGETGTGKTIIATCYMLSLQRSKVIDKILVLCPASLIQNWKKKVNEYYQTSFIFKSIESARKNPNNIINLCGEKYGVIVDEAHRVGNISQQTKGVHAIAREAKALCYMTATPITKNFQNFIQQILSFDVLPISTIADFEREYCIFAKSSNDKKQYISAYIGLNELLNMIMPYFYRLQKNELNLNIDIKKEIINIKTEPHIASILSQLKEEVDGNIDKKKLYKIIDTYEKISSGFDFKITEKNKIETGETFLGIKQKDEAIKKIIKEKENDPIIIWYRFTKESDHLLTLFPKAKRLWGGQKPKEKEKIVNSFQKGEIPILIANIAIGIGIDLFRSNKCIFYNTTFSYVEKKQSLDRIHRIGQKAKEIYVWEIIIENSISEWHNSTLEIKEKLTNKLIKNS